MGFWRVYWSVVGGFSASRLPFSPLKKVSRMATEIPNLVIKDE
jgi:hypothetical protein